MLLESNVPYYYACRYLALPSAGFCIQASSSSPGSDVWRSIERPPTHKMDKTQGEEIVRCGYHRQLRTQALPPFPRISKQPRSYDGRTDGISLPMGAIQYLLSSLHPGSMAENCREGTSKYQYRPFSNFGFRHSPMSHVSRDMGWLH
jgi:hypothetical protein